MAMNNREKYHPSDTLKHILNGEYILPQRMQILVDSFKKTTRSLDEDFKKKHFSEPIVARKFEILKNLDDALCRGVKYGTIQHKAHVHTR